MRVIKQVDPHHKRCNVTSQTSLPDRNQFDPSSDTLDISSVEMNAAVVHVVESEKENKHI